MSAPRHPPGEGPRLRPGDLGARGVLHLVVGPSGVGKDTLIDAARTARPDLIYPKRVITRPVETGGEAHEPASDEAFERMEAAGAFLLSWRAHGLAYGIPAAAATALETGQGVVANASRSVIADARARFSPLRVIVVTASPDALARRLAARGRETEAQIAARLNRADLGCPTGPDVVGIDNGADLSAAKAAFLRALAPQLARSSA